MLARIGESMQTSLDFRNATQFHVLFPAFILLLASFASAAETLDGFITEQTASTDFYVGSIKIQVDAHTSCGTMYLDSDLTSKHTGGYWGTMPAENDIILHDHPVQHQPTMVSCDRKLWHIGARVRVITDSGAATGGLHATQVIAYSVNFLHHLSGDASSSGIEDAHLDEGQSGVLLEEAPQLRKTMRGWEGLLWLNGFPVAISPDTTLLESSKDTQLRYKNGSFWGGMTMKAFSQEPPVSLTANTMLTANTWAAYTAGSFQEGQPYVSSVQFWPNQTSPSERSYIDSLTPAMYLPDYDRDIAGTVKFHSRSANVSIEIVPNKAAQQLVQAVGDSIVPRYQVALPDTDPTKIRFHFIVVQEIDGQEGKSIHRMLTKPLHRSFSLPLTGRRLPAWNDVLLALPSGLVIVPSKTLLNLHSEAELATLLSYAVTVILQKQTFALANAIGVDGSEVIASLYERAIRMSTRQLYLSGYDLRQAPGAWVHAQGEDVDNPVIDSTTPGKGISWAQAYTFDYISRYYQDVDYSALKRGIGTYQQFVGNLRKEIQSH